MYAMSAYIEYEQGQGGNNDEFIIQQIWIQ